MAQLYPLLFEPVLKNYIWGGRNLETKLHRPLPDDAQIAESWDIAAHEDGTTAVANGPLAGTPLTHLLSDMGLDLIGRRSQWALERHKFPLLIKILDANRSLSVQVHPEDDFALEHEGNELGKTEMWVVLHARENAKIILGVKGGTTPALFGQALQAGRLEPYLHFVPVKTGDHICVPAGSLHAILDGLLIAEIQQNSNTTYRVYDWNRLGADGKPRPLHVEKALKVINFKQVEPAVSKPTVVEAQDGIKRALLCRNQYFTVERVELDANSVYEGHCTGETLEIWGTLKGEAAVIGGAVEITLAAVQFVLLPAKLGAFQIKSPQPSVLLRAYVGEV